MTKSLILRRKIYNNTLPPTPATALLRPTILGTPSLRLLVLPRRQIIPEITSLRLILGSRGHLRSRKFSKSTK
jgi:hypothetical protein